MSNNELDGIEVLNMGVLSGPPITPLTPHHSYWTEGAALAGVGPRLLMKGTQGIPRPVSDGGGMQLVEIAQGSSTAKLQITLRPSTIALDGEYLKIEAVVYNAGANNVVALDFQDGVVELISGSVNSNEMAVFTAHIVRSGASAQRYSAKMLVVGTAIQNYQIRARHNSLAQPWTNNFTISISGQGNAIMSSLMAWKMAY